MSYKNINLASDVDTRAASRAFAQHFGNVNGSARILSVKPDAHSAGRICVHYEGALSPAQEQAMQTFSFAKR